MAIDSRIVLAPYGGDGESEYRLAILLSPVHSLAHSSCFHSPKNTHQLGRFNLRNRAVANERENIQLETAQDTL
jgi:hypothetical protein